METEALYRNGLGDPESRQPFLSLLSSVVIFSFSSRAGFCELGSCLSFLSNGLFFRIALCHSRLVPVPPWSWKYTPLLLTLFFICLCSCPLSHIPFWSKTKSLRSLPNFVSSLLQLQRLTIFCSSLERLSLSLAASSTTRASIPVPSGSAKTQHAFQDSVAACWSGSPRLWLAVQTAVLDQDRTGPDSHSPQHRR
ncbi:hypothetical protein VTK73DRAFT_3825 [Phialemonium thermophilum]|uniref:Transmembrane protein n=1 Tax=Phialemonium thermophilum TaxID=223376 RepID=A0ABR3VGE0_9PEZI